MSVKREIYQRLIAGDLILETDVIPRGHQFITVSPKLAGEVLDGTMWPIYRKISEQGEVKKPTANSDYGAALFDELQSKENIHVGLNAPVRSRCIAVNIERLNAAIKKLHCA